MCKKNGEKKGDIMTFPWKDEWRQAHRDVEKGQNAENGKNNLGKRDPNPVYITCKTHHMRIVATSLLTG